METNEITRKHRKAQNLSYRGFANAINTKLINTNVSYSHVRRFEKETGYYEPDLRLLFECLATYDNWISVWAVENIIAMFPDLVQREMVVFHLPYKPCSDEKRHFSYRYIKAFDYCPTCGACLTVRFPELDQ